MTITRGSLVLGLALTFGACGGERAPTAGEATSIVGDWMICEDDACARLDNNGWRFAADGTARALDGSDGPPSEPVCVALSAEISSYRFEGGTLTLGELQVSATMAGNVLTLHDVPVMTGQGMSGTETVHMLRVQTTVSASCPSDPPPTP